MKTPAIWKAGIGVGLAAILAGCAVLRVDVDVYKGPLANHEDVQMEQLAVMAVGAETLIQSLEKSLESKQKDAELTSLLREVRYLFEDSDKIQDLDFAAHPEVLRGQTMIESGLRTLDKYTNAFARLKKGDGETVTKLKGKLKCGDQVLPLWEAYKAFLAPRQGDFRGAKNVIRAHVKVWECIKLADTPNKYDPVLLLRGTSEKDMSSNFAFEKLADKDLLRIHARVMFSEDEAELIFVAAVYDVASSFVEARNSIANLLELTLRGLEVAERIPFADRQRRDLLVFNLAKFAAQLIQPTHLRVALDSPAAKLFKDRLMAALPLEYAEDFRKWSHSNRQIVEAALINVLREKPASMGGVLLELHRSFKRELRLVSWSDVPDEKQKEFKESFRREYGLARGPTEEGEDLVATVEIEPYLEAIKKQLDSGLATRGRTRAGLYRLIEEYLNSRHNRADTKTIEERQRRLVEELIHFAEKLLFIANHDSLIASRSDSIGARRHVLVLQAVGNSILVQANELQERKAHESQHSRTNRTGEVEGLLHSVKLTPMAQFDGILDTRRSQLAQAMAATKVAQSNYDAATNALAQAEAGGTTTSNAWSKAHTAKDEADNKSGESQDNYKMVKDTDTVFKQDATDWSNFMAEPSEPADSPAFLDKTIAWITNRLSSVTSRDKKSEVTNAKAFWDKLKSQGFTFTAANHQGRIDEAKNCIADNLKSAQDQLGVDTNKLKETATTLEQKAKEKDEAEQQKDKAAKNKEAADGALKRATDAQAQLEGAVKAIGLLKGEAIQAFQKPRQSKTLLQVLKDTVQDKIAEAEKATNEVDMKLYGQASKTLAEVPLPLDPQEIDKTTIPKHASDRDVLDKLIAALRYEHIESVRQFGTNGPSARIEAALQLAYQQRAGMVYIRPPAAYLRTSYAATSLQDDPGLGWRNMLAQQAWRSFPGASSLKPQSEIDRAKITTEIDKQFWQNINSVRVAGGGNTQYVLAKDDIGNWYVKSYSSNPSNIINSAKSLAMFSLGSATKTDLLSRVSGGGTGKKTDASQSTLEKLYGRHQDTYLMSLTNDLAKTIDLLGNGGLSNQIDVAWSGLSSLTNGTAEFTNALKTTLLNVLRNTDAKPLTNAGKELAVLRGQFDKPAATNLTARLGAGSQIVSALQTIRRWHNNLVVGAKLTGECEKQVRDAQAAINKDPNDTTAQTNLATAKANLDTATKVQADAVSTATQIVRNALNDLEDRRRRAVKEFDNAILFIGEAGKP